MPLVIKSESIGSNLDETLQEFNPEEDTIYDTVQRLNIDCENPLLFCKGIHCIQENNSIGF